MGIDTHVLGISTVYLSLYPRKALDKSRHSLVVQATLRLALGHYAASLSLTLYVGALGIPSSQPKAGFTLRSNHVTAA